jgi:hypothetical protein
MCVRPAHHTVIQELLAEGPHRQAARALGAQLRQCDGAVAGADVLERVLALSPVRRR